MKDTLLFQKIYDAFRLKKSYKYYNKEIGKVLVFLMQNLI